MDRSRGQQGRVVGAHRITSSAFQLMAVFLVVGASWLVIRELSGTGSWWGPLHVFLVGGVLLAISGATQLFSVTWAAATPPGWLMVTSQRWMTAVGAAITIVGVSSGWEPLTLAGAALVLGGLVLLGLILVRVARRSLLRRFGLSTRFYLLAIGCGIVGVSLGAIIGVGASGLSFLDARTAHMHLNLVGLVAFTIFGTLPTLLPTTAHHKMVSGVEATVAFWLCSVGAIAMAGGVFLGPETVGVGVALAGLAGSGILAGIVGRLGWQSYRRSSLPGWLISTGSVWILAWCGLQAVTLVGGSHTVFSPTTAAGAGGVALVLFGSLAYLVPVLAGPGKALGVTFPIMHGAAVARVIGANLIVGLVLIGVPSPVSVVLVIVWVLDYGARAVRVVVHGRKREVTGLEITRRGG